MANAADGDGAPRWLDDCELHTWRNFGALLLRLPTELDRQLQRDSDLSLFEYFVLAGLSGAEDRSLRMSTLATWTGAQLPRLSQVASRMEARGWVSRRPDPTDGRYTLATLTDEGFAVLKDAAPGHVEQVRTLFLDPLTRTQVKQLGVIVDRLLTNLSPDAPMPRSRRVVD